jgi:hypothetical protein
MIEKMVSFDRAKGIKFAIPSWQLNGRAGEGESKDDDDDDESYGPPRISIHSLMSSPLRGKVQPKSILKQPGDETSKGRQKKSVRFAIPGDESDADDAEKEKRARESVRRKLAEGSELSKRFLSSFFGWSKNHHDKRSSDDDDEDDDEYEDVHIYDDGNDGSLDSDTGDSEESGEGDSIASAEESWYRTHVFENQTRNLAHLKELEMRLEEMVRSKGGTGGEEGAACQGNEDDMDTSSSGETDEWAESPVYAAPAPEAQPDEVRAKRSSGQKRRTLESLSSSLISSMSGARKKLLSR